MINCMSPTCHIDPAVEIVQLIILTALLEQIQSAHGNICPLQMTLLFSNSLMRTTVLFQH